ncbi:RRM-3 domain-containing protein [Mycena indigotica]|uniref:RRM-3 domain-containing protein n=1 Tax=Mycena indigotica TaxID=2126181 RepID=A0A8H6VXN8_9AGAR|nr:RRM-3 domain-containing protein [Mycena indigotica]KAF7295696.1 RRM-3 domain-containing protein [Mycena indigotica]
MTDTFAFLPRQFASKRKPPTPHSTAPSHRNNPPASTLIQELSAPQPASDARFEENDVPLLLALSLSKYWLWMNPELRMDIERCTRVRANDNFFPLSYILAPPSPLSSLEASETQIAKALRTHGTSLVDLRMTIPSADHKRKAGSFEIRPAFDSGGEGDYPTTRKGWDDRTVYVENLPVKCKTLAGVCRFISSLLLPQEGPGPSTPSSDCTRIQNIVSPGSHSDDEPPKLKSFALVTFKTVKDAISLVESWPWTGLQSLHETEAENKKEAFRFGFRACSKTIWEGLNAEYLRYQQQLAHPTRFAPKQHDIDRDEPRIPTSSPSLSITLPSYPPNCLVFIRNLDHGTNKTALRVLFSTALGYDAGTVDEAIDYVDYTKGVDSCHVRLTSPLHANALVKFYTDAAGAIKAELITGTREEVYWERVPEKVRQQAVMRLVGGSGTETEEREPKRRKKR